MENDKKATGRAVTFILPKAIGDVVTHVVETGSIPVLLEELASYEKENYSF
jgi:3-dehydroquinate synthetase